MQKPTKKEEHAHLLRIAKIQTNTWTKKGEQAHLLRIAKIQTNTWLVKTCLQNNEKWRTLF